MQEPAASRSGASFDIGKRFFSGLVAVLWLTYLFVPMLATNLTRNAVFLPSDEWNAVWYWYAALGMLIGFGLLAAASVATAGVVHILLDRGLSGIGKTGRKAFIWTAAALAMTLPFWGWALERSTLRIWAHESAPTLGRAATAAFVISYNENKRTGGKAAGSFYRIRVDVPPYGRLVLSAPYLPRELRPAKGTEMVITGRQSWVGVSYDTLQWPAEMLAAGDAQRR